MSFPQEYKGNISLDVLNSFINWHLLVNHVFNVEYPKVTLQRIAWDYAQIQVYGHLKFFNDYKVLRYERTIIIEGKHFLSPESSSPSLVNAIDMDYPIGLFLVSAKRNHDFDDLKANKYVYHYLAAAYAEAAAEYLSQLQNTKVIRPAFGYSLLPSHQGKRYAFDLLEIPEWCSLTTTNMIVPETSVCGMMIKPKQNSPDLM